MQRFDKTRGDRAIQDLIVRDVKNGRQAGVRRVPAVFVNGKRLKNRRLPGFQRIIEAELKKRG